MELEEVKRSVLSRVQVIKRQFGGAWKIFRRVKLFCMILEWLIHVIIHLPKPMDCVTPSVNSDVNNGLQVIINIGSLVTLVYYIYAR